MKRIISSLLILSLILSFNITNVNADNLEQGTGIVDSGEVYIISIERELVKADIDIINSNCRDINKIYAAIARLTNIRDKQLISAIVKREVNEAIYSGKLQIESLQVTELPDRGDSEPTGNSIVDYAYQFLGVPYQYGGTTPAGFDCSGFTAYVYRHAADIEITRTTFTQRYQGKSIAWSEMQPGDLVFTSGYGHVGIYVGGGKYIHSQQPGDRVKVSNITNFVEARRIIDGSIQMNRLNLKAGETVQITNKGDSKITLALEANKKLEAVLYIKGYEDTQEIKELRNDIYIPKDGVLKVTSLETSSDSTIMYPLNVELISEKIDTKALYTFPIEVGKTYEIDNNSNSAFYGRLFSYEKIDLLVDNGYEVSTIEDGVFPNDRIYEYGKVRFRKNSGENIEIKLPYELKDKIKEVTTPLFEKITLSQNECLELDEGDKKIIHYLTTATSENNIKYTQLSKGNADGPMYELKRNITGNQYFRGISKIIIENGESLEVTLPYGYVDINKTNNTKIYETIEIQSDKVYELKNIIQKPNEYLRLSVDTIPGTNTSAIDGVAYNYKGDKLSINIYQNNFFARGGEVIRFKTVENTPCNIYVPIEYKELIQTVEGTVDKPYGYELEDINKDSKVNVTDLSMVAAQYNKKDPTAPDESGNVIYQDFSFDNRLDFDENSLIDLFDLVKVAKKF